MGVNKMKPWEEYAIKPWENYSRQTLQPMTEEQRLSALELAKGIRPQTDKTFGDYLAENVADAVYGADRAISGATLGGSDWLKRRTGLGLNQDDYLAMKEYNNGSALPAQAAGFVADIGGNVLGGGGAIAKGLMNKGLTGLPLLMASSGVEGAVYGATGSDTWGDLPKNVAISGSLGTALPVAFKGVGEGIKKIASPFIPSMATKGLKGGLENVVENPDSIRLLNRGIKSSDDVANEVLLQSRPVARDINKQSANMIDDALTSRIDVPEAIRNANARYGQYMDLHGADEVFDLAPTTKQILEYPAESNFNSPQWKLSDEESADILLKKAKDSGIDVFGDIKHYTKKGDRGQYVRTLSNTLERPDLKYTMDVKNSKGDWVKRDYLAKKYNETTKEGKKPFFDFIVTEDGKLYNKFKPKKLDYIDNQLKNSPQDVSLTGKLIGAEPTHGQPMNYYNNIPLNNIVVNNNLPRISSLYEGLTDFQSGRLDNAIKTGFSKTNAKQGSLESMNKVKQEINEQIKKAQVTDKPSEVLQLQDLKKKFDSAMPEGLKAVDKGYEKAKRLESAFDRGTHYNPNNVDGADYINELSPLEKNAFAQGLFKRINNNSLANKNLAKTAMDYDNTLADVLSSDKYNELTRNLNKQSVMFDRLAGLGRKAESKLNTPEAQRFFGREQLESKGSLLGSALDLIDSSLRRNYYTNAGKNLLNPNYNGELSAMGKVFNSADALANYLSTQNPLLGSGLSATALKNISNRND